MATHVIDVTIPSGTRMQTGKIVPQPNFDASKNRELRTSFSDKVRSSNFKNMRPLK